MITVLLAMCIIHILLSIVIFFGIYQICHLEFVNICLSLPTFSGMLCFFSDIMKEIDFIFAYCCWPAKALFALLHLITLLSQLPVCHWQFGSPR